MTKKTVGDISLGARISPPDYRDVPFAAVVAIPESIPDNYFPTFIDSLPVWYQRQIGACVAHAWAKSQQKNEFQETSKIVALSPRFLYALAKSQDGFSGEGTYPRLVAKILQKQGCATEATVPNDTTLSHSQYIDLSKIPQKAYDEAAKYAISNYAFVNNEADELKKAIYYAGEQRKNIVMLVDLGKEWWTNTDGVNSWVAIDILPLRTPTVIVSGHEIYPYAYETDFRGLKIWFLNSWSEQWGYKGRGYFYYEEYRNYIREIMVGVDLSDDWQNEVNNLPPAQTFKHYFGVDVAYGQSNNEVRQLQIALKISGEFPKSIAETGFYGLITQAAVKAFQTRYSVASALEIWYVDGKRVGQKTRKKLNELFNK